MAKLAVCRRCDREFRQFATMENKLVFKNNIATLLCCRNICTVCSMGSNPWWGSGSLSAIPNFQARSQIVIQEKSAGSELPDFTCFTL
jgi:hypothetical protein